MKNKKGILMLSVSALVLVVLVAAYLPRKSGGNDKEAILIQTIMAGLKQLHYNPPAIDDAFSKKIYALYVDRLDNGKRFFTQEDITQLKSFETQLDDETNNGSFAFFDLSVKTMDKSMAKTQGFYKEFLAQPFDYTKREEIQTSGEKRSFAKNDTELKDLWRKLMKYETLDRLSEKLEKQEKKDSLYVTKTYTQLDSAARAETLKVYDDYYKRMGKLKRNDRLSDYLNCITNVFDPHTNYFEPVDKTNFDIEMSGRLIGIGAKLQTDIDYTRIAEIIPGGPADKQGELKEGDIILKVAQGDKEPVDAVGMQSNEVVSMIRGKLNTEVRLTVKRKVDGTTKIVTIIREEVVVDDGFARSLILENNNIKNEKIGYIKLPRFYADFDKADGRFCSDDVATELEKLKKENVTSIILDLRGNGGGSLRDVVKMAGLFIEQGPIVQVKGRGNRPDILADDDNRVQYTGPLVVMVNSGSASASEILAAALQDYGRAVIVGGKSTYGKGTVQRFFNLDAALRGSDDLKPLGDVKVTIQKFYRVNGGSTQLKGVMPDIEMPDYYSYIKVGEKETEYPMEWSQINPVGYTQNVVKLDNLDQIKAASLARMASSPVFKKLDESARRTQKVREESIFPLNMKDFRAYEAKQKTESEKYKDLFKNEIVGIRTENLKADLKSIEKDKSHTERNKKWKEGIRKDTYIEESINILHDMTTHDWAMKK